MLGDVLLVLDELVAHRLLDVAGFRAELSRTLLGRQSRSIQRIIWIVKSYPSRFNNPERSL
jgi:hypothetical protein